MKKRLDQHLTDKELTPTRSQAQLLIREGKVKVNGQKIEKPGHLVLEEDKINVDIQERYVGRGALKLKAAVEEFGIRVKGKVVADCGASTGGFTDYLLQNGIKKVYCLDVGHDQLDPKLRKDKRVVNLEGINLKQPQKLDEAVDLVVADLSFISLRLVFQTMHSFLKEGGEMILLFKPQFEVGKEGVNKNGVVKNEKRRKKTLDEFLEWCRQEGVKILGVMESPIEGKKGNVEFLIWLTLNIET